MKPCLECGRLSNDSRCPDCRRARDRARNTARGDRYGAEHRHTRAAWAPEVATGFVRCARCDVLIAPGDEWAVDHLDDGRSAPSHRRCNESARTDADPHWW